MHKNSNWIEPIKLVWLLFCLPVCLQCTKHERINLIVNMQFLCYACDVSQLPYIANLLLSVVVVQEPYVYEFVQVGFNCLKFEFVFCNPKLKLTPLICLYLFFFFADFSNLNQLEFGPFRKNGLRTLIYLPTCSCCL